MFALNIFKSKTYCNQNDRIKIFIIRSLASLKYILIIIHILRHTHAHIEKTENGKKRNNIFK
jgi:hypothetical protein